MACKTCDHAMQCVDSDAKVFWCPRCGSLFIYESDPGEQQRRGPTEAPQIVEYVRQQIGATRFHIHDEALFRTLAECSCLPADRPEWEGAK